MVYMEMNMVEEAMTMETNKESRPNRGRHGIQQRQRMKMGQMVGGRARGTSKVLSTRCPFAQQCLQVLATNRQY